MKLSLARRVAMAALAATIVCAACDSGKKEPVDLVNNRIGNISHLLVPTFPTAQLPNAMLRMNPGHNEFTTDRMSGLPMNVPSHRQGNVTLMMPFCGDKSVVQFNYPYRYDHEQTSPYRYSVYLDDFGVVMDFAPAEHSAILCCTYEQEGDRFLQLRNMNGNGKIYAEGNKMWGYDVYHGTKHFFYAEFDQTPVAFNGKDGDGIRYAQFAPEVSVVKMRYGVSYIDEKQARKHMEREISSFDIEKVAEAGRKAWNKCLSKIEVEGGTEDERITFYTALYRSHERMINISEDGRYRSPFDKQVHDDKGMPYWTDDWAWDTYHALHPLQIILNPEDETEKLNSFVRMYRESGWVPTFPTVFGDAHCMNGNHAAAIFADALCKGIEFDVEGAFEGMHHTVLSETMIPWLRGPKTELDDFYHLNGWFPALYPDEKETVPGVNSFEQRQAVAVTLAASYDDWCIAQLAKKLGRKEDYNFHIGRSFNYRKLFNHETGFFHPRDAKGEFIQPFDYIFSGGIGARAYYDENNAWTYIWDVHHNIGDLIALFGSEERFIAQLDQLFVEDMKTSKWKYYAVHPDASGNVGQYVMGNEPSFHIPYLYNYAGEPWKTQKRIRMLMKAWFRNDLMGVCGDEDGGGMSAFYVFSAMGFYPVTAGLPYYVIGSPLFDKVSINLDNGKTFTVVAQNNSEENKYIQSATLNGQPFNRTYFSHEDITSGGELVLVMGNRPCKTWGVGADAIPPSEGSKVRIWE
ncbi:MAG: GH92 family glycosyl hydrolase [Alistipes sp.]|nr:GH92 family glycosyl hydrolase [Alistipes sp.]